MTLTNGNVSGLIMIKTVSNIAQFTEIYQGNQNIFDHSGAKWNQKSKYVLVPGHLGVVQHTQVKKLGIVLNFIEIRGGPMFVLRIQEHLNQVTQDLWPPLLRLRCCQNSNFLTNTACVMSKWPEKKLMFDLWDYIWVQNLEIEQIGCQNTQSQIFWLEFFKIFLNPQPPMGQFSSERWVFAVPRSQQSITEGKFGKKLRKSCKHVIWSDLEFRITVIIKGKRHSLCTFCEHSRAQKSTVC